MTKSSSKKKRAPNVKPKKPVVFTPDLAIEMVDTTEEAGDAVVFALDVIVSAAAAILNKHAIEAQCIVDTSEHAWKTCLQAVEMGLLQHEFGEVHKKDGEVVTATGELYNAENDHHTHTVYTIQSWDLGDEPPCVPIDTFGTGVVRTKRRSKKKTGKDETMPMQPSLPLAGKPTRPRSRGHKRTSQKKVKKAKASAPVKIEIVPTEEEIKLEKMRLTELKKLDHKKRMIQRGKQREEKEKLEIARYQKIQNDLKGKNFTYDEEGNVVMIKNLVPERLPGLQTNPSMSIVSTDDSKEVPDKKKKSNKEKKSKKRQKKHAIPPSHPGRTAFVDSKDLGPDPMLLFKPLKGVTVTQGVNTITGPSSNEEASHRKSMTRSEYNRHISTMHGHPPVTYSPVPSAPSSAKRHRSQPPTATGLPHALTQSPEVNENVDLTPPPALNMLSKPGGVSRAPGPRMADSFSGNEDDDFNNSIMNDPTWGSQHNIVPAGERGLRMPSNPLSPAQRAQVREKTFDKRARLPRDRQYVEKHHSGSRKHLPPPVYPATSGHGFVDVDESEGDFGVTLPNIFSKPLTASLPEAMKTSHRSEITNGQIKYESTKARQMF